MPQSWGRSRSLHPDSSKSLVYAFSKSPFENFQSALKLILVLGWSDEAGPRYRMHDPATWAKQAKMAAEAQWEELEAYQAKLDGGREVKE